jgi:hypothetical protein
MREKALRWAPLAAPRTSKHAVAVIILRIGVTKIGVLKVSSPMRWIWSVKAELEDLRPEVSTKEHFVVLDEVAHNPDAPLS